MSNVKHRLYNEETLKVMIPQDSSPQFKGHFSKDMYDEWFENKGVLHLSCGCTSFSIDKEREEITFTIKAPSFPHPLPKPYLKTVRPTFRSKITNLYVEWPIKFNVNPTK